MAEETLIHPSFPSQANPKRAHEGSQSELPSKDFGDEMRDYYKKTSPSAERSKEGQQRYYEYFKSKSQ